MLVRHHIYLRMEECFYATICDRKAVENIKVQFLFVSGCKCCANIAQGHVVYVFMITIRVTYHNLFLDPDYYDSSLFIRI